MWKSVVVLLLFGSSAFGQDEEPFGLFVFGEAEQGSTIEDLRGAIQEGEFSDSPSSSVPEPESGDVTVGPGHDAGGVNLPVGQLDEIGFDWGPLYARLLSLSGQVRSKFGIDLFTFANAADLQPLRFSFPVIGSVVVPIVPDHVSDPFLRSAASVLVGFFRYFVSLVFTWLGFVRIVKSFAEVT